MTPRTPAVFERLDMLEWHLCQRLASFSIYRPWLATLRLASRLGDWPAWVALIGVQPLLYGRTGWAWSLQFTVTALLAILVYRLIKTRLCRERPFITFHSIPCTMPARDRYSFPSGHTMHAVMFCWLCAATQPEMLFIVVPLSLLIAASRVGLGLHYISDVLGGALIGSAFAWLSLRLFSPIA
ncbi:phosphatase PAP2 family protein [Litchfieldella qijiaojingensis]|uniref:undecaprenyl-diphosphate phosphatase n=1 Tax=Litchfieldella qijiaojingensis TaxID=980347 RepID=A0ABQ2YEX2_9GAMM|nr:phosphatase PAP2 family protein [Halomonas qijiaojingensis]GGX79546.1 phosphatase PAP2 family protein [Halomonas qijiaojingensis]